MVDLSVWIENLIESDAVVIVEGKNDTKALAHFGVTDIIELQGKAIFQVVEEVVSTGKSCVILTDLDKKGRQLFGTLHSNLSRFGVRCDNSFREELFRTKLRQVEGLVGYVRG